MAAWDTGGSATHHGLDGSVTTPLRAIATAAAHVQRWAHETEGRRRTREALRPLERSGWHVDHDISLPDGASVDHLVLGPCGVFVVDSRAWDGVVTVDNKGPTITPRHDPRGAWTAYGHHRSLPPAAAAVVRRLAAATGGAVRAPRAVVAIWATFPEQVAESGGVTYVAGSHLARWLSEQPRRLAMSEVNALTVAGAAALVSSQRASVLAADRRPALG
jgi:hypothetical protein